MSGLISAGSQLFSVGSQALSATGLMPAFIRAQRQIDTIIPDVTIEEHHSDRMEITNHPVASGSPISDHAYRQPSQVVMRLGWTNSNPLGAVGSGFSSGGGFSDLAGGLAGAATGALSAFTEQRVKDIYATLLSLQAGGTPGTTDPKPMPFALTTGKRNYKNMLIAELRVTTDRHSEYSLMVEARMQEVIIVTTSTTDTPGQADQAQPSKTASTTDTGTTKPRESFLSKGATFFGYTPPAGGYKPFG
jgi:hypothetical protein